MKRFRVCAYVKDGNKRVGYLVCDTRTWGDWVLIDDNKFKELVKRNKVQFLTMENNTVKCKYTFGELRELKRYSKYILDEQQSDFWGVTACFKASHIDEILNNTKVTCSVGEIYNLFGKQICDLTLYGNTNTLRQKVQLILNIFPEFNDTIRYKGGNNAYIYLPVSLINTFVNTVDGILYNTSTIRHYTNIDNNTSNESLKERADKNIMQRAINIFEKV